MLKWLWKKLFGNKTYDYYVATSEADESGRFRYHIYKNGELIKENIIFETWKEIKE